MPAPQFPATAQIAPQSASISTQSARFPLRAATASTLAMAVALGLSVIGEAQARGSVTIDETVLESLGPEPSIASLVLRAPRMMANPNRPLDRPVARSTPAPRALAQAPSEAPRSRLLLPGAAPASPPAPQIAAAPPVLRLPQTTAVAAAPSLRPAPAEAPRSRLVTAPMLTPPPAYSAPALSPPPPQVAAVGPLLPTPPVAPMASGVRAAPTEAPRSQLLLPPAPAQPAARAPAPAPVAAAPSPSTSPWPSLAGSAVAAPLPPTAAFPPPAAAPTPARPVAAAAPTARDILPPAPSTVPAVAPSAVPPSAAARPAAIGARLLFQRGTLDPADGSREALTRLATQLAAAPNRRVQIMAYAVGADSATENSNDARRLSLDRALAVRSGLVQQGVRSTQVTVRALGNPGGEGPPDRVDILLLDE